MIAATSTLLRCGSLVLVALALWLFSRPSGPPRNVILVSIDTLRADHLGTYGYERATSPNLDRLARRSVVFDQAVAQAPNTLPSHAALLTSTYYRALPGLSRGQDSRLAPGATTLARLLKERGFATGGFVDGGFLSRAFGLGQGFDDYDDKGSGIAEIAVKAERWIDAHRASRFFLFVHCYDVHAPYSPPSPFDRKFEETPYAGSFEPTMENLNAVAGWKRAIAPDELRHVVALYDGGIAYTDQQLGIFFAELERRGLLSSTVLIVTADHGEEFKEHGSMLHWQSYYMPNLHVPLIVSVPGRAAERIDGVVELIDVLPSVLELLGVPAAPHAMGRSLVATMDGRAQPAERVAYSEPFSSEVPLATVITDRYQLLYNPNNGKSHLIDIRPGAAPVDLAEREPAVAGALLAALKDRQERVEVAKAEAAKHEATAPVALDEQTRRRLRALGYTQ
ncbi:MAG TPA: sulfatase [Candidatus Bathyarchaeia archaeon]|nr:sulfatase [Candidatus Bathyarchaeia archaeon]